MGHGSVILVSDYFTRRVGGSSSEKLEASFHAAVIASDPFNDWGGGAGMNNFVPVFGGNGTKIAPTGDIFDQPPGQMR